MMHGCHDWVEVERGGSAERISACLAILSDKEAAMYVDTHASLLNLFASSSSFWVVSLFQRGREVEAPEKLRLNYLFIL